MTCRKLQSPLMEQKMSDLPRNRVTPAPPFTYVGVDYFGPWKIKERRKELKRYGALFTCLVSRSVHIEVADSLDTDAFINALRRFIARRGLVREIRSDNGTNFTGADRELKACLDEMNQDRNCLSMVSSGCSIHPLQATWAVPGNVLYAQLERCSQVYCTSMAIVWI